MSDIDPKAPSDTGANARRMRAERQACAGLSDAELESNIVADAMAVLASIHRRRAVFLANDPGSVALIQAVDGVVARLDSYGSEL